MTTPQVLILDNGAYNIKAGISGIDWEPRVIPNSIARSRTEKKVYVADEIESCGDLSNLAYRRPFERGMLVNWDAQKVIWDRIFSPECMSINPTETSLLVTEPYFNLPNIAETYDQMVFEEWEFASYYRSTPASLIPYGGLFEDDSGLPPECCIVVDVGYSFTHVIPMRDGQIIWEHVKRIDIGGKLLTNHLKHLISFRQWNMIEQTAIVNAVRESCCYVSMDYARDLALCKKTPRRNPIIQEYVLPDFSPNSTSRTGYIRSGPNSVPSPEGEGSKAVSSKTKGVDEEEQVLYMGNERFTGCELLFSPSDIGIKQSGLPETIAHVISDMQSELQGMFWAHIGIFGGLGMIPNLGERLERDLRALCPTGFEIGIFEAFDTAAPPYHAALNLTSSEAYLPSYPILRSEYLESGSSACRRRFGGLAYSVNPPGFQSGMAEAEMDDDERERRYALGLLDAETRRKGVKGGKGKKRDVEEEVVSGNWGGRRRRALGGGMM